jgi:nitroreductase
MRKIIGLFMILITNLIYSQDLMTIKLNEPSKKRGTDIMEAFEKRASVREWTTDELSLQDLSDLLWAANGVNRPIEKKRTAPSAMNSQDIDIYVFKKEGVYLYDAFNNLLKPVVAGDYRQLFGSQQSPIVLLLVSDISRFKSGDDEHKKKVAAMDAGIVSQNIAIFCAGTGMKTRPRVSMNIEEIKKVLSLSENQLPLINMPVSY